MKEERQAPTGKGRPAAMKTAQAKATPIADIEVVGEDRRLTHIGEFDRVLGGGVIPGSVILIGGDPGIGKTTLLLQALPRLSSKEEPVLYVSGEESPRQIKMRGQRLGIEHPNLLILAETSLEQILKAAQEIQPAAMVVDSIQTVYTDHVRARQHQPGAGGGRPIDVVREAQQRAGFHHRTCHQRGRDCRTATVGTYRRYGALFRRRQGP
jgi:DNA repair protein RadA/Sms